MNGWVETWWMSILKYRPKVTMLLNAWFYFHFLYYEDAACIVARLWVKGREFLSLQRWHDRFNPLKDVLRRNILYVKLSGFPLELGSRRPSKQ